jgi:hypothetical protein
MTHDRASILVASLLPLLASGTGCRSRETTASRSAAAYDEARQRGAPIQKAEGHGPHGTASGKTEAPAPGPHAEHDATAREPAPGAKAAARHEMAGMDHSRSAGRQPSGGQTAHAHPAGAAHSQQPVGSAMDHSKMGHAKPTADSRPAGMDHAAMGHGQQMPPPAPEPAAAVARPGQPAATLRPDEIDSPASTSVRDAERSAELAKEMAGGHAMQHGAPYKQIDAGRDSGTQPSPAPRPTPTPRHHESGR